jgi:hypothetical protein
MNNGSMHGTMPASGVAFVVPRAREIWLHSPVRLLDSRAVETP